MAINLNTGVTIRNLYTTASAEEIAKIEEAAKDGFTEDELQQLEKDGIDTTLIKQNSTAAGADKAANTNKTSVADKAKEIKEKYCKDIQAATGDAYSANNPELKAFSKAMDDGLLEELGKAGYNKTEIVDIINQAFPSIGIKNKEDGSYECPYGHGNEAKAIYDKFVDNLAKATTVDSAALIEAQNKLSKINTEIVQNNRELKNLEYNITILQQSIEQKINDAIDKSKDIEESQKEDAKNVVSDRLNEYTSSNGKMTYEEFQKNVASDLDGLSGEANSKLSKAVLQILDAQRDMSTLKGYMSKMSTVIANNKNLTTQADEVKASIDKIKANATNEDKDRNRCDPIGFSDNDGKRYDFFVDKDSDGNVTNENEFLGAENGFQEMKDADANGDGKVTADELDAKNVKMVVTNSDGTQEIKNATDVLKEGDSIDLASYQSQNTELENGNALLGTFSVNMGGQKLDTGYQTLDKLDWLDENFEFSDEINGVGRHIRTEGEVSKAEDYTEKYNLFTQNFEKLKSKQQEAMAALNLTSSEVEDGITNAAENDAKTRAASISKVFEETKAQEKKEAALNNANDSEAKPIGDENTATDNVNNLNAEGLSEEEIERLKEQNAVYLDGDN